MEIFSILVFVFFVCFLLGCSYRQHRLINDHEAVSVSSSSSPPRIRTRPQTAESARPISYYNGFVFDRQRPRDEEEKAAMRARREALSVQIPLGTVLKTSEKEIMGDFGDDKIKIIEKNAACAICLTEFEHGETIRTSGGGSSSCEHIFHDKCILDWLEAPNHQECPCCRSNYFNVEESGADIEMGVRRNIRPAGRGEGDATQNNATRPMVIDTSGLRYLFGRI